MARDNLDSFFGAHGRTDASRSNSSSRSRTEGTSSSYRSSSHQDSRSGASRGGGSHQTSQAGTSANGYRVRIATPDENLARDLRDMSDADLDREMQRLRGGSSSSRSQASGYHGGSRSSEMTARYEGSSRDDGSSRSFSGLADEWERQRQGGGS
ncbi:hypothetical protein BU26DRAFT_507088 [Trematosphaeria pertusa]|uniref:Uncharacterized protein n=1 Tax=Trematosphaeria pertusa TaxID=390896 RepID=A0A6A6I8U4_9PLEO|nr:uncharacterized protein BU26DRAFT_507088 [Trematosphaeria pertusa]KAF2246498.1 hypothetical protein BU26DRAFT_507088 [Trematosphaeria pertusa]